MTPATDSPFPRPPYWPLGDAARPSGAVVALVPGQEAPVVTLSLPSTLRGMARLQVARRQVQDRLGLSGALIWPLAEGAVWTRAVVAAPQDAQRWRKALEGAGGGRCKAMLPDYLALPAAPGLWVLTAAPDGRILARLGLDDGFSAEPALAQAMLARMPDAPRAVLILGEGIDPTLLGPQAVGVALHRRVADLPVDLRPATTTPGPVLGVDLRTEAPVDAAAPLARALRAALLPVVLVLLGAGAWTAATILQTRADLAQADMLRATVEEAARRDILPPGPIIDLRAQVLRAVDARRDGAHPALAVDPLEVLRQASGPLTGARVDRLVLDPETGLSAQLWLADFAALDALTEALTQVGLRVATQRSSADPQGGVTAQLSIGVGTP